MARSCGWLAGLVLLTGCGTTAHEAPAPRPTEGERLTVRPTDIVETKPLTAEIRTRDQAEALARIPGILADLRVRAGDQVSKGQLIGRIVDSRLGFETSAYEAQTAAAAAEAQAATAELSRVEYLYRQSVYAKARLDQAQATARAAEAQVRAARSRRAASAALSGQGAILAPAAGRVLKADITPGSVVQPGMSIATITAGPALLRLDVPESLARQVHRGTAVTVADDGPLRSSQGVVRQIYPAVAAGRVRVDVDMAGLSTEFVGRSVNAWVQVGTHRGIIVPRRFVSSRFGVDYVDLVAKDGSWASMPVQTAPTTDPAQVELLAGVAAGDILVARKNPQ